MRLCKLLLAAASATVCLGAFVGIASARTFMTSSQTYRATYREVEIAGLFGVTVCELVTEGSFHSRNIAKTAGSLIGYITRATLGACAAGTATIQQLTLPWHVRYLAFTGTLPNIISIRANIIEVGARAREPGGIECLARSSAAQPITATFTRTLATGEIRSADLAGTINTGPECGGAPVTLSAFSTSVTVLNAATKITVTLI
ncbi:MAG TPA: hypothetical protein VF250_11490 [Conexibacter sp.]